MGDYATDIKYIMGGDDGMIILAQSYIMGDGIIWEVIRLLNLTVIGND